MYAVQNGWSASSPSQSGCSTGSKIVLESFIKKDRYPDLLHGNTIVESVCACVRAAEKARSRREALTAVGSLDIAAVPVSKISDVAANITAGFNDKVRG